MRESQRRFTRQQGFAADANHSLYAALMFQPRVILCLVALGILLQSQWFFLALSAVLWWNALVPTRNPFDAIYNRVIAYPRRLPSLGVAPGPRRFAQGMAGTFGFAIVAALFLGASITAWVFEGLLVSAAAIVVFGRFCVGSYVHHFLRRGPTIGEPSLPRVHQQ
jgi:hypothetical protein